MMTVKYIDLFCGIGGFHQALKKLNCQCVYACDIDKECRSVYETNYGIIPEGDITKIDVKTIPDFDILTSGNPCQSFSSAGKKKGLQDKRGKLFDYVVNIIKEKSPKFIFLENVKHIKKVDNGEVYKYIYKQLQDCGYDVKDFEISPHQLGIPQKRERVIFVGIRNDIFTSHISLELSPKKIKLKKFLETNADAKYNISDELNDVLTAWDEMVKHVEVGEKLSPVILANELQNTYTDEQLKEKRKWEQDYIVKNKPIYEKYKDKWDEWYGNHKDILGEKSIYSKFDWQVGKKKEDDSIFKQFIQIRQSGIRVKKTDHFPTLVAMVQTPIYGKEKRYITPRECARLQSFPDDFIIHPKDNIAYKQFGNAVNVKVVYKVISCVLKEYDS